MHIHCGYGPVASIVQNMLKQITWSCHVVMSHVAVPLSLLTVINVDEHRKKYALLLWYC